MNDIANSFELADWLMRKPVIDGVRVDAPRDVIVVAYAPEERHVEHPPEGFAEAIDEIVDTTRFQREGDRLAVERHEWTNGWTNTPVTPARDQPAGYELQQQLIAPTTAQIQRELTEPL